MSVANYFVITHLFKSIWDFLKAVTNAGYGVSRYILVGPFLNA